MKTNRIISVVCGAALTFGLLAGYAIRAARADGVADSGLLTYTGTLEDTAGKPISGTKSIGVAVWDAATAGTKVCEAPASGVSVSNGRFDVVLPDSCATAAKANPKLWIEVTVENESLGRARMGAVPYAIEAARASEAAGGLKTTIDQKADKASVPIVTDWTEYVPGGGCSDAWNKRHIARWRRVGDTIEVKGVFERDIDQPIPACGTYFGVTIPAGIAIRDDFPGPGTRTSGTATAWDASHQFVGVVATEAATNGAIFYMASNDGVNLTQGIGPNYPIAFKTLSMTFSFTAPVQGWTATQ